MGHRVVLTKGGISNMDSGPNDNTHFAASQSKHSLGVNDLGYQTNAQSYRYSVTILAAPARRVNQKGVGCPDTQRRAGACTGLGYPRRAAKQPNWHTTLRGRLHSPVLVYRQLAEKTLGENRIPLTLRRSSLSIYKSGLAFRKGNKNPGLRTPSPGRDGQIYTL